MIHVLPVNCIELSIVLVVRFQRHTTEAAKLEAEVSKAQDTITAAQQLISQLDGEHTRWNTQVGRHAGGLVLCLCATEFGSDG